eukprot:1157429-Pelagomonas_calceolata.AAC.3
MHSNFCQGPLSGLVKPHDGAAACLASNFALPPARGYLESSLQRSDKAKQARLLPVSHFYPGQAGSYPRHPTLNKATSERSAFLACNTLSPGCPSSSVETASLGSEHLLQDKNAVSETN